MVIAVVGMLSLLAASECVQYGQPYVYESQGVDGEVRM